DDSSVIAGGDLTVEATLSGDIDAGVGAGSVAVSGAGSGVSAALSGAGASATNTIAVDVEATLDGDGSPASGPGVLADRITLQPQDISIVTADVGAASVAAAVGSTTSFAFSIAVALADNKIDNTVVASISNANNGIQTRVHGSDNSITVDVDEDSSITATT